MRKKVVQKINWFGLCENAWFPWQPVMLFSRKGVDLQNQSYLSFFLSYTTKRGIKLKPRHRPFFPWSDIQIISFAY